MLAYRKTNGRAHDLRCVPDDYVAQDGEILVDAHDLPPIDTLHDPVDPNVAHNAAIDAQIISLETTSGGYVRGMREFMLATALVVKQGNGPDFMLNVGMQKVKALDDQIAQLRKQRK